MQNQNLSETQPGPSRSADTRPMRVRAVGARRKFPWIALLLAGVVLALSLAAGGAAGYASGRLARQQWDANRSVQSVQEQFNLGLQDLANGQYEVARQRFEFILNQDPNFPGAAEKLAEALAILYATATPTQLPPTGAPTPTRDLRPVQELFDQAQSLIAAQDWSAAIDVLSALRKAESSFQVAQVDRRMYLALRQRGVIKILQESNLEGGIYDLSLAERFGPLDGEANIAREWARLYIMGSSFWEAYPEQAVYYFGQVASAAPGLQDASGWSAMERYRGALIQYADQLAASEDWCRAQEQYELAMNIRTDGALEAVYTIAVEGCTPPTATPTATVDTPTPSLTLPPSALPVFTETPTPEFILTATETSTQEVLPTPTVPPTTPPAAASETPTLETAPTTEAPPLVTSTPEPAASATTAATSEATATFTTSPSNLEATVTEAPAEDTVNP